MHFSRSPFMALAVTATIGRFLPCGSLRISFMVAMPSISGIMMSISTTLICGSLATRLIASRPLSDQTMSMPCSSSTVASAKMLRMSSSTISTRLPASGLLVWWISSSMERFASGSRARLWCSAIRVWSNSRGTVCTSCTVTVSSEVQGVRPSAGGPLRYNTSGSGPSVDWPCSARLQSWGLRLPKPSSITTQSNCSSSSACSSFSALRTTTALI